MTTSSKKPKINTESTQRVNNLPTTDELYRGYGSYIKMINEENQRNKSNFHKTIIEDGGSLLDEMEEYKGLREDIRVKMVKFVAKKSEREFKIINSLSDDDLLQQYGYYKANSISFIDKLMSFFFK